MPGSTLGTQKLSWSLLMRSAQSIEREEPDAVWNDRCYKGRYWRKKKGALSLAHGCGTKKDILEEVTFRGSP
jgi:hypothetical protein